MPVASLSTMLQSAQANTYGVLAFNVVDGLTMDGVLAAAAQTKSCVIIQMSERLVRFWGARVIYSLFQELVARHNVTACLHLDHCADIDLIHTCLLAGWNSALFDAPGLSYTERSLKTRELVAFAQEYGAHIEGELETIASVGEKNTANESIPIDLCLTFIQETGIACFSPALGTAHGMYEHEPVIDFDKARSLSQQGNIPLTLHGGTGLRSEVLHKLIHCGITKINISTRLKMTYMHSLHTYIEEHPGKYDPQHLLSHVHMDIAAMAAEYMHMLDCEGRVE